MTPCVECPSKASPRLSTIPMSRTGSGSACSSATPVATVTKHAGVRGDRAPSLAFVGSPQAGLAGHAGGWIDGSGRAGDRLVNFACSPDGIRTHATAVRGRRPRPLDDGARTDPRCQHSSPAYAHLIACGGQSLLGYQDSNLELLFAFC